MVLRRKSLKLSTLSIPYLAKRGHFGFWKYPGARVRKPYPTGETYNLPKFRSKAIRGATEPKEARALYNQPRSRAVLPPSTSGHSYGLPEFRSKAVKQVPQPERAKPVHRESLPYKEPPPKLPEPVTPPTVQEVVRSTEERRAPEVKPTAAKVRTESRAPSISLRRERRPEPAEVEEPPVEERKPSPPPEKKPAPRPAPERQVISEQGVEERLPPRRAEAPREVEVAPEEARRPERRRPTPAPREEAPPTEEPREELPPSEPEAPPEERDPVQDLVEYVERISEAPEAPPEYRTAVDEIVRSAEAGNYANIPEIVNELPPDDNLTTIVNRLVEQYVPTEREAPPPTEEPTRVGRPVVPEVRPSRLREGEEPPPPRVSAEEAANAIATAQEGGVTPDSQRQVQTMLQEMPPQELVRLGEQLGSTGETPEELINDIMASAGAPPAEEERRAAREEFIDSYLNEVRSQIRSIAGGETDVRNAKDAKLTNNLIGDAIEAGDIDSALDAVDNYLVAVDPQGNDIKYNPLREIVARLGRLRQSEIEAETREAGGGIPAERALGVAPEIRERVAPRIPTVGRGRIAEGRPPERRAEAEATPFPETEPAPPTPEPELGRAETRRKLPSPEELRERYREKPKEVKLAPSPLPFKEPPRPISPLLGRLKSGLGDPLPTEEQLKSATIVPLIPGSDVGQASTPVSKVTIGDKNYFIKESKSEEASLNEIIASGLGDLVGVIIPKAAKINSPYPSGVISNWVDGKSLDSFPDPVSKVRLLPKDVIARYILFGYLVEDVDAHYGQYMITSDGELVRVDTEFFFYHYTEDDLGEEIDLKTHAAWTIAKWNALYNGIGGNSYAEKEMGNNLPIPHQVINEFISAGPEMVRILDEAGMIEAAQGVSQRLEWLSQIQDDPNPTIGDFLYNVLGWEDAKPPEPTLREEIEAPVEQPYTPLQRKTPNQLLDYTESVRTILDKAWRENRNHRDMVRVALVFAKKVRRYMTDERSRNAIKVAERWLEGKATDEEVDEAGNNAFDVYGESGDEASYAAVALIELVGITETIAVPDAVGIAAEASGGALWERVGRRIGASYENIKDEQRQIIRDILGSPFLPDGDISPSVFRSEDVAGLARSIAAGGVTPTGALKRANALPILADALEEAGLEELEILDDLRSPGPHHRGMWSLELVLRGANKFQPTVRAPTPPLERKGEPPIIMGLPPGSPPIDFPFNSSIVQYNEFTPELTEEVISYAERFAKVIGRGSALYPGYEAVLNDFSPEAGTPYHSYIVSRDVDGNINGLMLFQDYLISVPGQEAFYITNVLSRQPVTPRLFREAAREASSRDVPLVVAAKKSTFSDVEPADLAERVGIYSFDKQGNAVLLPQYAKVFAETGVVPNVLDKLNSFVKSVDLRKRVAGGRSDAIKKLKRDLRDVESQVRSLEKIIRVDPSENNPENKSLIHQLNLEWKRIKEQINHEEAPRTDAGRRVIESFIEGASRWNRDTGDLPTLPIFDPKTGKSRDLGVLGAFNEAVDFVDKIISKDVYNGPRAIKAKSAGETRSFYDSFDQSVNINPTSDASIVVHEIFHFFANTIDNWERLCYEFMMCFAAGQVPESLKFLYPNSGYRDNEFVRKLDIGYFTGSAAWYLGKIYRDGTTEIPAMLGQALFSDPVGFCNACPLGATFILALLLGELRNEIPWDEEESL